MGSSGVKFTVSNPHGITALTKALGKTTAKGLVNKLDKTTEAHALKIVNDAKNNAPIKTGQLKRSIKVYQKPAEMARVIGSNVPYATRQEYENKTKKAFFRNALRKGQQPLEKDVEKAIKDLT